MPYPPKFTAPEWQTSRISALRQQFAAPQVGRLKREMAPWMIGGGGPQRGQEIRDAMRGYGEGLGGIMGGAGKLALSQYGQEYGKEFEAAKLTYGEKAKWGFEKEFGGGEGEGAGGAGGADTLTGTGTRTDPFRENIVQGKFDPAGMPKTAEELESYFTSIGKPPGWAAQTMESWRGRSTGGDVRPTYKVGEKGVELVKYDNGHFELVGRRGPEIRTFAKKGTVIPAGKTKKMLKSMYSTPISRQGGGRVAHSKYPPEIKWPGYAGTMSRVIRDFISAKMGGKAHWAGYGGTYNEGASPNMRPPGMPLDEWYRLRKKRLSSQQARQSGKKKRRC